MTIYTDGACKRNPGPGGWGAVLYYRDAKNALHQKEVCGGMADTTNNQMELTAAIEALKLLKGRCQVILYTDSVYVKDGITQWIQGWRKRGWKKSGGGAVVNVDLWRRLDEVATLHEVDWRWVKGHSGDPGNERADELANLGVLPYLNN